jgi:hypothetical protein
MPIDETEATVIAAALIEEIAADWQDRPDARCIREGGTYVFEFTIKPSQIVRYARVVSRPEAITIVRFNPLAEAAEIVSTASFINQFRKTESEETRHLLLLEECKNSIREMLAIAPRVFEGAIQDARLIGDTRRGIEEMRIVGRPDLSRSLTDSAQRIITDRIRGYFGHISRARTPKISIASIAHAMNAALAEFRASKKIPSQRQFAKQLGVTPKAWRDYLTKSGLPEHNEYLKAILSGTAKRLESDGEFPAKE